MIDYDYDRWTKYILKIFKMQNVTPKYIADIACGTGSFTIRLSDRGYELIGIDSSEDMLNVAKNKSLDLGLDIPFIHQDIRHLSLHRNMDAIICMCDGFNYILSKKDLKMSFKRVYESLEQAGIFIFDISSYYKLKNILGNNVMADASEDISLIWFNEFFKEELICRMDLTFFLRSKDVYTRFDETHFQRAYTLEDIVDNLLDIGFTDTQVYTPFTFDSARENDHRWVFVAKK
ncbi:MAG: class I SAM-dependent methyltransferase [Clostridiales bacterium]|nr:class I SAM-dependent methyltransferase [Clostridiales bacterium]